MSKAFLYRLYSKAPQRRAKRLTNEGTVVVIVVVGSALVGIDTGRTVIYQMFTLFLALLLISLVWSRFFRLRVTVDRIFPKFGTVGEPLDYQLVFKNLSRRGQNGLNMLEQLEGAPLTEEEFVNTPEPGEEYRNAYDRTLLVYRWIWLMVRKQGAEVQEQPLLPLPPHGEVHVPATVRPIRRGYIQFAGLTITRPDPLHLAQASIHVPLRQSVLILPKRYDLPDIRLPGHRKFKLGGVALASSVGESEEFVALREYRPGDPLRRIHWKSWAKTGKPIVKEFQDEYFVRHALVLDTFQQSAYSEIFEEAVAVAASFAYTVRTQDSLLDLMFVGAEAYCFTAGRGLAHTEQMLEILACVTPCQTKPFSVLPPLVLERAALLSGCICIFVNWDQARREFVGQLRTLGIPLLVLVVADQQHTPPDGETQERPEHFYMLEVGNIQEGLMSIEL